MRKYFYCALFAFVLLTSCEGTSDAGYDNAGLTEEEQAHARKLIDSSLVKMKRELVYLDSLESAKVRREIHALKEEIASLNARKK